MSSSVARMCAPTRVVHTRRRRRRAAMVCASATRVHAPKDAPTDAYDALRGVRVTSASTGDTVDLAEVIASSTRASVGGAASEAITVVTFLRSFG